MASKLQLIVLVLYTRNWPPSRDPCFRRQPSSLPTSLGRCPTNNLHSRNYTWALQGQWTLSQWHGRVWPKHQIGGMTRWHQVDVARSNTPVLSTQTVTNGCRLTQHSYVISRWCSQPITWPIGWVIVGILWQLGYRYMVPLKIIVDINEKTNITFREI